MFGQLADGAVQGLGLGRNGGVGGGRPSVQGGLGLGGQPLHRAVDPPGQVAAEQSSAHQQQSADEEGVRRIPGPGQPFRVQDPAIILGSAQAHGHGDPVFVPPGLGPMDHLDEFGGGLLGQGAAAPRVGGHPVGGQAQDSDAGPAGVGSRQEMGRFRPIGPGFDLGLGLRQVDPGLAFGLSQGQEPQGAQGQDGRQEGGEQAVEAEGAEIHGAGSSTKCFAGKPPDCLADGFTTLPPFLLHLLFPTNLPMHRFALLLLLATTVFAEASGPGAVPVVAPVEGVAPAGAAAQQPSMLPSILLMVGIFAFMWFVLIRPQKKEEKRRKEMIEAMKRGDKVVTIGGVHGVVETVGESTIDVRVGDGSGLVVTYNKGAVQQNVSAEQANASKK